jgi:AcrR family transcriptional regulator
VVALARNVKSGPAKPQRTYDASRRRAAALARRERVLSAARELFLGDGFAATTVAAIANQAEVSSETIYKRFGGKAGLIEALYREALMGEGTVPAYTRSEDLKSQTDARDVIRGWSRLSMEVGPRVTKIQLLLRDACLLEPDLQSMLDELDADRLARMTHNAEYLDAAGHLRKGVTVEHAAELMWSVTAPEMIELLVQRRSWSLEQYAEFVYDVLANGLLRPT